MSCRDCPYVKEEFDRRVNWYLDEYEQNGSPNDIYGDCTLDDIKKFEIESCWCDKTGGKLNMYGQCGDAEDVVVPMFSRRKRARRTKRERDQKHKAYLKRLYEASSEAPHPVYPIDKNGKITCFESYMSYTGELIIPEEAVYFKRHYLSKRKWNAFKYYKKHSNKMVHRYKGELPVKGNGYRKIFDYWWTIY